MSDDSESRKADLYLDSLEKIDDDCDVAGINFVKVDDPKAAKDVYGLDELPKLVLFQNQLPNVYDGTLIYERSFSCPYPVAVAYTSSSTFSLPAFLLCAVRVKAHWHLSQIGLFLTQSNPDLWQHDVFWTFRQRCRTVCHLERCSHEIELEHSVYVL